MFPSISNSRPLEVVAIMPVRGSAHVFIFGLQSLHRCAVRPERGGR